MAKAGPIDSQDFSRESKSNAGASIEAYRSGNATENGKRYDCTSRMCDCHYQAFHYLLCQDFQIAVVDNEEDKLGASLIFIRQSSRQPAKGTLQLDQSHGEFNVHRAIRSEPSR